MGTVKTRLLEVNYGEIRAKTKQRTTKVVHGGYSFIATGKLPKHRVYLLRYLSACREGLINDLCGEENLSTAQLIIIDRIISKFGILRFAEEHRKKEVVFRGGDGPCPQSKSILPGI